MYREILIQFNLNIKHDLDKPCQKSPFKHGTIKGLFSKTTLSHVAKSFDFREFVYLLI